MKKILGIHIFNNTILLHTVGVVGLPLTTMFFVVLGSFFMKTHGLGDVVAGLIGLAVLFALCFYYWYLAWHFVKLSVLFYYGKTADAVFTEHHYERRKSVSTNKGRTSVTYTDVYSGELAFTTAANEPILLKFEVKDPGREREAVKQKTSLIQVLYLPRRPHIACIAWQGADVYRRQLSVAFGMTFIWFILAAAVAYEQSLSSELRLIPEAISSIVAVAYVLMPFVAWIAMGRARKRFV